MSIDSLKSYLLDIVKPSNRFVVKSVNFTTSKSKNDIAEMYIKFIFKAFIRDKRNEAITSKNILNEYISDRKTREETFHKIAETYNLKNKNITKKNNLHDINTSLFEFSNKVKRNSYFSSLHNNDNTTYISEKLVQSSINKYFKNSKQQDLIKPSKGLLNKFKVEVKDLENWSSTLINKYKNRTNIYIKKNPVTHKIEELQYVKKKENTIFRNHVLENISNYWSKNNYSTSSNKKIDTTKVGSKALNRFDSLLFNYKSNKLSFYNIFKKNSHSSPSNSHTIYNNIDWAICDYELKLPISQESFNNKDSGLLKYVDIPVENIKLNAYNTTLTLTEYSDITEVIFDSYLDFLRTLDYIILTTSTVSLITVVVTMILYSSHKNKYIFNIIKEYLPGLNITIFQKKFFKYPKERGALKECVAALKEHKFVYAITCANLYFFFNFVVYSTSVYTYKYYVLCPLLLALAQKILHRLRGLEILNESDDNKCCKKGD